MASSSTRASCLPPARANGTQRRASSQVCRRAVSPLAVIKGYDTYDFVETLRALEATPHIAQKAKSRTLDGRTTRHVGYQLSQRARKRIEEVLGWMKSVGGVRKVRHRGGARANWQFLFTAAAYNLMRLRNLQSATT
jgi:IS5 family transposase